MQRCSFGIADRKRSSCFRPFKVADNTTIRPRKNVADYQRRANLPHRPDSFPANHRAHKFARRRMWRKNREGFYKRWTWRRTDDKYSTAGRSKNVAAVIRQYECNLGWELLRNVQFFESPVFTFFFPPSVCHCVSMENDGPGVWTARVVSQALKVTM